MLNYPERLIPVEVMALGINLTTCTRTIEVICEQQFLTLLVKRVQRTFDPLLMKLIHNIATCNAQQVHQRLQVCVLTISIHLNMIYFACLCLR